MTQDTPGISLSLVQADVALLEQPAAGQHQILDALVAAEGDLNRVLRRDIRAQPHVGQQVDALDEAARRAPWGR